MYADTIMPQMSNGPAARTTVYWVELSTGSGAIQIFIGSSLLPDRATTRYDISWYSLSAGVSDRAMARYSKPNPYSVWSFLFSPREVKLYAPRPGKKNTRITKGMGRVVPP